MSEIIAALSTAYGIGGVAIIRISGKNCLELAKKMFNPLKKIDVSDFEPYKLYVGEIVADDFCDKGMCVYFKAPHSFTGEDVVEFHCHGGIAICRGVLSKIFSLGARPAVNGEFTKRAFLNGKLSLSSCEGLIDMINSESKSQIKAGYYLFKEKLKNKIVGIQDEITDILAEIDANIDYPEEDLIEPDYSSVKEKLCKIYDRLIELSTTYKCGKKLSEGVKVAIVGRTNTGKSSLLNVLLGEQRAIVTDINGTTRDVLEGIFTINDVKFTLFDTAGIRQTDDTVERIGIERSENLIDKADLVMFMLDGSNKITQEDLTIYQKVKQNQHIVVLNKVDLFDKVDCEIKPDVVISCKNNTNIDKLKQILFDFGVGNKVDGEFITEERHYYVITDACEIMKKAIENIKVFPIDLVCYDIKNCWTKLGEITGTTASETIIDDIFKKFCVGK